MNRASRFCLLVAGLSLLAEWAFAGETTNLRPCLWEVQAGTNKVYLFGTIHFSASNFFPLPKVIEEALDRSTVVMFENDIDEEASPAGHSNLLAIARCRSGDTLKNHLSPGAYSNLQAFVIATGEEASYLDHLKPIMAALAVDNYALQKAGFDRVHGVDNYIWDKAKKQKKGIIPFESYKETLDIVASLSDREQERVLVETLRAVLQTNQVQLGEAWRRGEAALIEKAISEGMQGEPGLRKRLVDDRNKNWLPSIEAVIRRRQDAFVAVGIGHFLGKDSLVDLLSQRGFQVRRL